MMMRRLSPVLAAAALPSLPTLALGASLLGASLVAVAVAPAAAQAQQAPGAIQGTFVLDRAASDNVDRAIDAAVKPMNFITRPIARGRLQKTNQPYQRVTIAPAGSETQVTINGTASRKAPSDGRAIAWTREDGEKFNLSMAWENGRLVESFKAEDGQRVNTYMLSPDGSTLTMNVVVSSPRLEKPLTYKLVFKRA